MAWRRHLLRPAVILTVLSTSLAAVLLIVGAWVLSVPVDGGLAPELGRSASLILEDAKGDAFATRGTLRGDPIAADRLPQPLTNAVIAVEDRRFRDHGGIDLRGIMRATVRNVSAGRAREGGSTITQQLARLRYLSRERSLTRKVQEVLVALWLENHLSKDEILARYLSSAYFGAGAWGADAAARRYFGKSAAELSLAEAAMLAGLIRAPSQLAPTRNLDGARRRAETVLTAMVETGRATEGDAAAARTKPAELRSPPEVMPGRGWFADWAEGETRRLLGLVPVDLAARTTLDPVLQDIAERVVATWLDREGARLSASQAALVVMSYDGAVMAVVGGRDYTASQFNRVTQARRQPGSLFKLFVYAAALEAGAGPDTLVMDQPVRIGTWEPQNYGGTFRGATTLREAFAQSINTVAVQLSEAAGRQRVAAVAKRLGLTSDVPLVPSLALGSVEATLIDMTRAFATVAAGRSVEPTILREVRTRDRALYTHVPTAAPAAPPLTPAVRQQLVDLLLAAVNDGTGHNARLDRPVAGKTGTTQESRDAWFIGFTADAVVGVWVGNDDNSPMKGVTGGELPARLWRDFMVQSDQAKVASAAAAAPTPQARADALAPQSLAPSSDPAPADAVTLRGRAAVLDTATLHIGGQMIRLAGIIGLSSDYAREMSLYLQGRDVECTPAREQPGFHRCRVGQRDLAEIVLFNGAGRAVADADPALRLAEDSARSAGRGMWR